MPSMLTINVTNNSPSTQMFYFFQEPAVFSGGGMAYSDSLYVRPLENYSATGSVLTVQMSEQPVACIQQALSTPQIGQLPGFASAIRSIALASSGEALNDATTASIKPLGLSQPRYDPGVQPGAFRITFPAYAPPEIYIAGSAVEVNDRFVLSSFVVPNPNHNIDCRPIQRFYVQTGNCTLGSVIDFISSSVNAALCDFTGGQSVINVTYNADGTWMTEVVH